MKDKILSCVIAKSGQSLDYKQISTMGDNKLRITIRSDSYRQQCYARIDRWNGTEWKNVDYISPERMSTEDKLAYTQQANNIDANQAYVNSWFINDRNTLLKSAESILL